MMMPWRSKSVQKKKHFIQTQIRIHPNQENIKYLKCITNVQLFGDVIQKCMLSSNKLNEINEHIHFIARQKSIPISIVNQSGSSHLWNTEERIRSVFSKTYKYQNIGSIWVANPQWISAKCSQYSYICCQSIGIGLRIFRPYLTYCNESWTLIKSLVQQIVCTSCVWKQHTTPKLKSMAMAKKYLVQILERKQKNFHSIRVVRHKFVLSSQQELSMSVS